MSAAKVRLFFHTGKKNGRKSKDFLPQDKNRERAVPSADHASQTENAEKTA
jgi:hypothetical protein